MIYPIKMIHMDSMDKAGKQHTEHRQHLFFAKAFIAKKKRKALKSFSLSLFPFVMEGTFSCDRFTVITDEVLLPFSMFHIPIMTDIRMFR